LIALIVASVIAVTLESIPDVEAAHAQAFYWFEVITVAAFSVEYFLRLWCAVEDEDLQYPGRSPFVIRIRYFFSAYALIDLLAVLPFYLVITSTMGAVDMRFLRCVRLLRILKLTRYSSAFEILVTTCKENFRPLAAAFFVLLTVMLLAAMGMYFFERHAQPVAFRSIPDSMWWAVSTLTTVGYGDVTPVTTAGKIFGALITIIGVGMVALPTGILASGYSTQSQLRSERYQLETKKALQDGVITDAERQHLDEQRSNIAMSKSTAAQILDREMANPSRSLADAGQNCPHCGATPAKETAS
jgi:voltage-gated potassium channel